MTEQHRRDAIVSADIAGDSRLTCLLLAHSGHAFVRQQCPILGEKRTLPCPASLESIYWAHAHVDRATLNRSVRRVPPAGRDAAAAPAARPCGRETRPRGA